MEYALFAITCALLLAVIILIVIVVKLSKKQSNPQSTISEKDIGMLSQQIKSLEDTVKKEVELSMAKEAVKNNELQNEKLERFQTNIIETMTKRFEAINLQIGEKMKEINQKVEEKLKEGFQGTSETIAQVRERLKVIDEAQKNMENLSKDVISLRSIMEGNQTRGAYGEYQLEMVLHNVFGDTVGCYQEQFTIKRGKDGNDVRADAVVFMPEPNKMICIDSKFPFQDYEKLMKEEDETQKEEYKKAFARAVKMHITTIKDKYIIEGKTAQEALMFIPNDGVFAYIHQSLQDVVEYAREKRVILTSPSTLPAILVTINMVRIESERAKNVKEISKQLEFLGRQFAQFTKEWDAFSRQLELTSRTREKLDTRVNRIANKFDAIASNSETPLIEEEQSDE